MPYLTKNNKNILFIRVPRNGSASLSVSFEQNGWEHVCRPNSNADIKRRLVIKYASFSEHIRKIKKNNLSIDDIQYIFTVLRDPVERVESFFRMMIGRGPNSETSKNPGSYKGGFTINEMYPDGPDTTLIPIDTWWYQFKDRILEGLWTKSQAPLVNGLLTWDHCGGHTNINKDIFLYKKETYKNIYTTLSNRLNINLPVVHIHAPPTESLYNYCFSDKVKKEIQNYYIKDYELIDKLTRERGFS